jgi:hypothetical protein
MKRTLLALLFAPLVGAGPAAAVEPSAPAPPAAPVAPAPPVAPVWPAPPILPAVMATPPTPGAPTQPLPPLPPLPPMGHPMGASKSQELPVKGPVTLRVDGVAIEIEAVGGNGKQVRAQLYDSSGGLHLVERGDRVDVVFDSGSGWPHIPGGMDGHLRIELPPGSHVELSTKDLV